MLLIRFSCNSKLIKCFITKDYVPFPALTCSELQHKLFFQLSFVLNFCDTLTFISDASVKNFCIKEMSKP